MSTKKTIEVIQPKPYEQVGAEFIVRGRIHESCLKSSGDSIDYRVLGGFVGINGIEFASTVYADVRPELFSKITKNFNFSTKAQFSQFNVPFIEQSQGCIALKLSTSKKGCVFFLPLVVKGFEPEGGVDPKILERHGKIGDLIKQYEVDLKSYYQELEEIRKNSLLKINVTENDDWMTRVDISDDKLLQELIRIFSSSKEEFERQYEIAKQAQKERALGEKYKEALKWRGPLFRGVVKKWKGFKFQIYSDDHGNHFHIKHAARNIDVRMSFPHLVIIDNTAMNMPKSKEIRAIRELFKNPELIKKAKEEFEKRIGI